MQNSELAKYVGFYAMCSYVIIWNINNIYIRGKHEEKIQTYIDSWTEYGEQCFK